MNVLWRSCENRDLPLTVRAVADQLPESAYTTVATVLGNLMRKEMVEKLRSGRLLLYRPRRTRAEYAADRMAEALATSRRPHVTLDQFIGALTPAQHAELVAALARASATPGADPAAGGAVGLARVPEIAVD
ncbi:BlaI/MecI/CopY family transcriptional regulator [Pseudactinotalea sp. HY158]|nr:BlaI/MecI/CopY family transcriptional regulator [Pseudactinotalea sp. HY158]